MFSQLTSTRIKKNGKENIGKCDRRCQEEIVYGKDEIQHDVLLVNMKVKN